MEKQYLIWKILRRRIGEAHGRHNEIMRKRDLKKEDGDEARSIKGIIIPRLNKQLKALEDKVLGDNDLLPGIDDDLGM